MSLAIQNQEFTPKQIEIIKNSICKGCTIEEFEIFLMACQKTQLDPFMRQIYAVKRWDNRLKRETMTIQTGIDGYRLIAERTGKYAPGPKPTFEYDTEGNLISATAYVKKMTNDGTWHIVEAEAFFDEYCQTSVDKNTGQVRKTGMWNNMERNQLAKCAESLALRKAFPAEMSGVYTKDEMQQSECTVLDAEDSRPVISAQQSYEIDSLLLQADPKYRTWFSKYILKTFKAASTSQLPVDMYDKAKLAISGNIKEYAQLLEAKKNEEQTQVLLEEIK